MDWKESLENVKFEITTGDGRKWNPLLPNDIKKNIKYNTDGFDFVGVDGSFVERKRRSGPQYPMVFYFEGEDCIQQFNLFELAARDRRSWTIKHPFLGTFKGQPITMNADYSQYNVVKVSCLIWQTISRKYPQSEVLPDQEINALKISTDARIRITITTSFVPATAQNVQPSIDSVTDVGVKYLLLIQTDTQAADLRNRVRQASGAAQDILADAGNYMQQTVNLINFPFIIAGNIDGKVNVIIENIETLADIFLRDKNNDKDKELYELQSTVMLSELSRNIVNESFETTSQVLSTIDKLSYAYELARTKMEDADHVPNADLSSELDVIINVTIASLFDLAFESKQERSIILPDDSNIVNLAHKYFGPGDDNLTDFIAKNNISLNEHLQVKKGRKIIYFV